MASGLAALLDDVAMIARLAAASVDDVAAAAGKAGTKAAGIVIDDAAVTPRYVTGIKPARELPIIWRIAKGSFRNKLLFLLPGAILLSQFAAFLIMPILLLGGLYLAFEGAEKLVEKVRGLGVEQGDPDIEQEKLLADPEREKTLTAGAIRTDLILSGEIMAISLNELSGLEHWWEEAIALALVGIAVTVVVYGAVALIVKMDDFGLHLAAEGRAASRWVGRQLVRGMPKLLVALSVIGTVAMIWVGGGIVVHAVESFGLDAPAHWIHDVSEGAAGRVAFLPGLIGWAVEAFFFGVVGFVAGIALIPFGHWAHSRFDKRSH